MSVMQEMGGNEAVVKVGVMVFMAIEGIASERRSVSMRSIENAEDVRFFLKRLNDFDDTYAFFNYRSILS
jgi:hypothetical protein